MVATIDSYSQYQDVASRATPSIVMFKAPWCSACKAMAPKYAQLSQQFTDIQFHVVDGDEQPEVAMDAEIQSLPSFLIFVDGARHDTVVGANLKQLEKVLQETQAHWTRLVQEEAARRSRPRHTGVHQIGSHEEYLAVVSDQSGLISIIDFQTPWCEPSQAISPDYQAFSQQYPQVAFYCVDGDEVPEAAIHASIEALPTFVVFSNGKLVSQTVGALASNIEGAIAQAITVPSSRVVV
ncbi:thioredoxin-like protein [Polychytrium aggregatum]|uniref:thioredoxin-like protein n=1 Tax=Polychytrium aggregatum TaxID=110093 RepID=UPI0022FF2A6F|nr:thioredoxin-like protein [Polychytrium aggregatum]KAI9204793.1 thioredoxin-like protein [Polychytrium aggregatum]